MISFLLILSGNKTLTENVKSGATTLLALLPTEFALQLIHERTNFLNSLQRKVGLSLSRITVFQYASDLKQSLIWIRAISPKLIISHKNVAFIGIDRLIQLIARPQLESVFNSIKNRYNNKTLARFEVVLQKFLKWCTSEEAGRVKTSHPWEINSDNIVRVNKGLIYSETGNIDDIVNFDMVKTHLLMLHNECERSLFHFIYDVGTRISEAISLRACDLPFPLNYNQKRANSVEEYAVLETGELYLPIKISGAKGLADTKKPRIVQISLPTLKRIDRYHRSKEYLLGIRKLGFSITDPNRPAFLTANGHLWTDDNARSQFRCGANRSHMPCWFKVHGLRGGAAYLILISEDQGITFEDRLITAKRQLGHRWLSTLEKYYATLPSPLLARFVKYSVGNYKWRYLHDLYQETYLAGQAHSEKRGHNIN